MIDDVAHTLLKLEECFVLGGEARTVYEKASVFGASEALLHQFEVHYADDAGVRNRAFALTKIRTIVRCIRCICGYEKTHESDETLRTLSNTEMAALKKSLRIH